MQGSVTLDMADVTLSAVSLRVDASAIDVDPPAEREKARFIGELTEGNRQSIRETMLGPDVLDAARWPSVTAVSVRVSGRLPALTLAMRVKIRGREHGVQVPLQVTATPEQVRAAGTVELLQTDFGITPYETFFGAIAVQDKIVVQFDIVAVPQS